MFTVTHELALIKILGLLFCTSAYVSVFQWNFGLLNYGMQDKRRITEVYIFERLDRLEELDFLFIPARNR